MEIHTTRKRPGRTFEAADIQLHARRRKRSIGVEVPSPDWAASNVTGNGVAAGDYAKVRMGALTFTDDMRPGDVLLLSGRGVLEERLQRHLCSPWNQTAIVISWNERIVVLESTSRPVCPDLTTGCLRTGVQVVAAEDKLERYNGKIALRQLTPSLSHRQVQLLTEFATRMWGRPFNTSPYYSARALHRRNHPGTHRRFFCTELVASAYQHIGVLDLPPNGRCESNYAPPDFAADTQSLSLKPDHSFGPQTFLTPESS